MFSPMAWSYWCDDTVCIVRRVDLGIRELFEKGGPGLTLGRNVLVYVPFMSLLVHWILGVGPLGHWP